MIIASTTSPTPPAHSQAVRAHSCIPEAGGVGHARGASRITLVDSVAESNNASRGGGFAMEGDSNVRLEGSVLHSNLAGQDGGSV